MNRFREALRAVPRLDADAIVDRLDDEEIARAYEGDRAEARRASGSAAESQGKTSTVSELTDRELEVFKLVARGLSNSEIAAMLFLSEATVKTHITHVLAKLRLRDRVQPVVLAYESGLVLPGAE